MTVSPPRAGASGHAGSPRMPRGRALRTLLAIVWEREARWEIRPRADRFKLRLALCTAAAVAAGAALALGAASGSLALASAVFLPLLAGLGMLAWRGTAAGPPAVIDLRALTVRVGERTIPRAEIGALVLTSAVVEGYPRYGRGVSGRAWVLHLQVRRTLEELAQHTGEYALVGAARRLAALLDVPLLDRCGPEGSTSVWRVGAGPAEWDAAALQASEVAPPVVARSMPSGIEISWPALPSAFANGLALAGAAAVGAALYEVFRHAHDPYRWGAMAALVTLALLLRGLVSRAFSAGAHTIVVGRRELVVHARAFPWTRRERREGVEDVRLSQVLAIGYGALGRGGAPRVAATSLDILSGEKPRLRLKLAPSVAAAVFSRLRAALGMEGGDSL